MRYCMKKVVQQMLECYAMDIRFLAAILAKISGKRRPAVLAGG